MKGSFLILIGIILLNTCYGQTPYEIEKDLEGKIFTTVEINASFPGGDTAWKHFLHLNLNTNIPANHNAPKGTYSFFTRFLVDQSGNISDIICEKNPGYGMCQEAIRVIKLSGKWKPATQNGYIVKAYRRLEFTFIVKQTP
jgi:periplasmic protein TonB